MYRHVKVILQKKHKISNIMHRVKHEDLTQDCSICLIVDKPTINSLYTQILSAEKVLYVPLF